MNIFFTKKGKGQKVILLHGWSGSHLSMSPLQDELSQVGFEVYNLDLPGFGKTPLTKPSMTLSDYVLATLDFMKEQQIENPILIGHSFGGKISAKIAIGDSVIAGLVLISASGIYPQNASKKGLMFKISGFGKVIFSLPILKIFFHPIRKFFYYYIVRERDYFNAGEKLRQTFININNEHLENNLRKIKVPTLIIWGEADRVTPLWMGKKMAELIPRARLEVIGGARHGLVFSYSEIISKLIYNYFKK